MIIQDEVIAYYEQKNDYHLMNDSPFFCNLVNKYLSLTTEREIDIIGTETYIQNILDKHKDNPVVKELQMVKCPVSYIQQGLRLVESMQFTFYLEHTS